jgi:RimJ/RimL family protein N-acetyltransferase
VSANGPGGRAPASRYGNSPRVWGRGLGAELAALLVAHGSHVLGLTELYATVAPRNVPSRRVLDRLGFRRLRDVRQDDGSLALLLIRPGAADGGAPTGSAGEG